MAAGSALATCPPAHARDDDNTKARGPMPTTASTALAWGGYLWRCSHCSGPLVGIVPPPVPCLRCQELPPGLCPPGPWVLTPLALNICPWVGAAGLFHRRS